jgi:hypothetical protein
MKKPCPMKKIPYVLGLLCLSAFVLSSCEKDDPMIIPGSTTVIADHTIAHEDILRSIPDEYINAARNDLHVAYQHTSHGTHVSRGMFGLPGYKAGDNILYAITNNDPQDDKLDFRDNALESYAESGVDASDLSRNETAFIQATRNYLNDPDNSEINVIMWSWCNIAGHDVATNYLPGMQTLINEYPSVAFIFMTGHANQNANVGDENPESQADLIINYCEENKFYCLDYYGIDSHDMAGNYWEDAGDDGNSSTGGNYYADWQNSHSIGNGYFENRGAPGGGVTYGAHNSQHITANRKAYAMWYILATIVGWDGE